MWRKGTTDWGTVGYSYREIVMQSHPFLVFPLSCSPLGKDRVYKNTSNWHMLETHPTKMTIRGNERVD